MNSDQLPKHEGSVDELDMDSISSVDDFIKELEAKERDLHITADLTIEIEDSEFDTAVLPDELRVDLASIESPKPKGSVQAHSPGTKTRIFELEREVDTLMARITELKAERNEVQEKSDRRLKDFENYKYRMDRERRGAFIEQISNLASQMLPVLDNLYRAIDSVDSTTKSAEFQQFFDGIVLVNHQVNEVFGDMGVQPIATVGEIFDPTFHEAVAIESRDDMPANTIIEELLRGYRIGNRVIRHSMVKVTAGGQQPPPANPGSAEEPTEAQFETPESDLPEFDLPDLEVE